MAENGWAFNLHSYGRGDAVQDVTTPSLEESGSRVEYRFPGGVSERYVNGPLSLQQRFRIAHRPMPAAEGPLVLHLNLAGDMRA